MEQGDSNDYKDDQNGHRDESTHQTASEDGNHSEETRYINNEDPDVLIGASEPFRASDLNSLSNIDPFDLRWGKDVKKKASCVVYDKSMFPFADVDNFDPNETFVSSLTGDVISEQRVNLDALFDIQSVSKSFILAGNFGIQRNESPNKNGSFFHCTFYPMKKEIQQNMSKDAQRFIDDGNAGGTSIISEILSFEILHKCFGAKLYKTETDVVYFPDGGKKIDYVCDISDIRIGVSVARAFRGTHLTHIDMNEQDATHMMRKKVTDLKQSSRYTTEKWSQIILHVFVRIKAVSNIITKVYEDITDDIKLKTILLVTITESSSFIYTNKWIAEDGLYPGFPEDLTKQFDPDDRQTLDDPEPQISDDKFLDIHSDRKTSVFPEHVVEKPDPHNRQALVIEEHNDMEVFKPHTIPLQDDFQDVGVGPQIGDDDLVAIAQAKVISGPVNTGQNTTQSCATTSVPHVPEIPTAANMPSQLQSPCSPPQLVKVQQNVVIHSPVSPFGEDITTAEDLPLEDQMGIHLRD